MKDEKITHRQEKDVKLRKNLCISITKTLQPLLLRKMAFLKEINSTTKKKDRRRDIYAGSHSFTFFSMSLKSSTRHE